MKKVLVYSWLVLLISAVGALFWYNDYRYKLPTPIPASYKTVNRGTTIMLPAALGFNNSKPVLLHFFNPDCPCSRFNLKHVRTLIKTYAGKVNFAVVLVSGNAQDVQKQFNLNVPVIKEASLALACGVYSTPQAVILTAKRQLHYRGNYNSSRYCTNKKTEYARLALHNLLSNMYAPIHQSATVAYGCGLANLNYDSNAVK